MGPIAAAGQAPAPTPPTEGPGGPILVITSPSNPFGRYYAEILRAEGLNEFSVANLDTVTASMLAAYDVALLANVALTPAQSSMFQAWVTGGGSVIAMRPDKQLYPLLGLADAGATLANAYMKVNAGAPQAAGIVSQSIQFHGTADLATGAGASTIATVYSTPDTATAHPAVAVQQAGAGRAAAFLFDLARSVVYTRQGNPAWAGQERDGWAPMRSDDLFFGASAADPQPDWVDRDRVAIPQADEQQRLLVNVILDLSFARKPLPRFWYLPRGGKAAIVMTGDDHANGGTAGRLDSYVANSPAGCSVTDWECIRATSYVYPATPLTDAQASAYANDGFEIALHLNTGCADWTSTTLRQFYLDQLAEFRTKYSSVPAPSTERTHCIAWSDWASHPKAQFERGIRFDDTYYYWPSDWVADRPGLFTGSGFPMRYADLDGTIIDVYQAATQMTDESGQSYPFTVDTLLDRALGPDGYYGVFTANMHTDAVASSESDAIVASALARHVPIVSARQMLEWLDGRNGSSFQSLTWDGRTLTFAVDAAAGSHGLRALIPTRSVGGTIVSVARGGTSIPFTVDTIKGVEYAFFDASGGSYQVTYAPDLTAPVISNLTADATGPDTARVAWATDEPATSRLEYGTAPESLTHSVEATTPSTSHALNLTGLSPTTTYYFRVRSSDASGNAAVAPDPAQPPASFDTPSSVVRDTTVADFSAGARDASLVISQDEDGEVRLRPAFGEEFSGTGLPSGWSFTPWGAGGSAIVSGGVLQVDGGSVTADLQYAADRSLEITAALTGDAFQSIGFATDLNNGPWALFSTGTGGQLIARSRGASDVDTAISGNWLGARHRYRIDWSAAAIGYFIDDVEVASHAVAISSAMRPVAASDFNAGGGAITVDAVRVGPYSASGTFLSRVLDASALGTWNEMSWTADTPAGTSLSVSVRSGNTPVPDASWSGLATIGASGSAVAAAGRYLQYRAQLSTTVPEVAPVLRDVIIGVTLAPDVTAPSISALAGRANSPTTAVVSWTTSEPADSVVRYGTSPDVLSNVARSDARTVAHGVTLINLVPGTTYFFRVTSADAAANTSTSPAPGDAPGTFVTLSGLFVDSAVPDFTAGTRDVSLYLSQDGDGEVRLTPALSEEFSGQALPAGWFATPWTAGQGSATVANGVLTVDGELAGISSTVSSGSSMEAAATFSNDPFQHIGFGLTVESAPWAMFSTATGGQVYARTNSGAAFAETPLGSQWLGAPHRYRIDWASDRVTFYIDTTPVASHAIAIAGSMHPLAASDFNGGGGAVVLDSLRVGPYAPAGVFLSRVFDAGTETNWGAIGWTADVPPGTALGISVRAGNTPTPDATWSPFLPLGASGVVVAATSRYLQYKAELSTMDPNTTPVLFDVSVGHVFNRAPVARGDAYTTGKSQSLTVAAPGVLANDGDVDGNAIAAAVVSGPSHGTLTLQPDGAFVYTAAAGFTGSDSFTYHVSDGGLWSNTTMVALTIEDAVSAVAIPGAPVSTDVEGDGATIADPIEASVTTPSGGSVTIDETTVSTENAPAGYTLLDETVQISAPAASPAQPLVLVFRLDASKVPPGENERTVQLFRNGVVVPNCDPTAGSAASPDPCVATRALLADGDVELTARTSAASEWRFGLRTANAAPVALDDQLGTILRGTALNLALPGVLANDSDADSNTLAAVLKTPPQHGTLSLNGNGSLTYTPEGGYSGADSFTYVANDGRTDSNVATVSITIVPPNTPPVASSLTVTTAEDVATPVTLTATDPDGDALTFAITTGPAHGTLSGTAPNITYAPAANYNGPDGFTFTASDGKATPSAATVTISVTAVNDAPSFTKGADQNVVSTAGAQSVAWATNISAGPANENGQAVDFSVTNNNAGLFSVQPSIAPNGVLTYTPSGIGGSASVTVRLHDNGGTANGGVDTSVPQTFAINVTAANRAPIANSQSVTVVTNTVRTITLSATDADNDPLTYTYTAPAHGTLAGTAPNLTYTPATGYTGADSFTFKANDGRADSNVATVSITVMPAGTSTMTSTLAVSVAQPQYSDQETFTVSVTSSVAGKAPAGSVAFKVGTQDVGIRPLTPVGDPNTTTTYQAVWTGPMLEPSPFGTAPTGQMKPGVHAVAASMVNVNPSFTATNPTAKSISVRKEDATVAYAGPASLSLGGSTTVPLTVRVVDAADGARGDIRNAQVQFFNRATNALLGTVNVTASDADPTTGTATLNWTASPGSYTIGFVVTNYYSRNSTADNVSVTVTK